jgi:ribonuclease HI
MQALVREMWYISDMANYKLFFDGSCGPKNPGGTAAYGFSLMLEGEMEPVETGYGIIGTGYGMTNNLAEFHALSKGLGSFILRHGGAQKHHLSVYGDSKLVIQVMNKHWSPRAGRPYYLAYEDASFNLKVIRRRGHVVTFDWIPREMNDLCDGLSKAHQKKV